MHVFQAGVARTAEEVRDCLARQINLACYGVEKPILEMQTATGTKDKIAQHWIDILLKKSREMKSSNPGRSSESIAEELREWLKSEPGDKMNPLLSIAGMLCSSAYWNFNHSPPFQAWTQHKIRQSKSCIQSCLGSSNMFGTSSTHVGQTMTEQHLLSACSPQISMD